MHMRLSGSRFVCVGGGVLQRCVFFKVRACRPRSLLSMRTLFPSTLERVSSFPSTGWLCGGEVSVDAIPQDRQW